jgi:hypothetical protein
LLLALVWPDHTAEELEALPVGSRDALLMAVHERLFGPLVEALAECPACHQRLETRISLPGLRARAAAAGEDGTIVDLRCGGYEIVARLPTGRDLASLASCGTVDEAERTLLETCIETARHEGQPIAARDLPRTVVDLLSERLSAVDPLADVWLRLTCAACRHGWSARLDIERFLFEALGAWAEQTLDEVHDLARAYAWSEAQILSLSPARRRDYLSRVRA